jgi:hypothetical protein
LLADCDGGSEDEEARGRIGAMALSSALGHLGRGRGRRLDRSQEKSSVVCGGAGKIGGEEAVAS